MIENFFSWYYKFKNQFSNASLLDGESQIVVSLTSHSGRISQAFAAIESIGSGKARPQRLILFLDRAFANEELPLTLKRLCKRGLEVIFCEDMGPHTKYFPYIQSQLKFNSPLVTADDDIMYPAYWLENLIKAWKANPLEINCFRARKISLTESGFEPYSKWKMCRSTEASISHFATGVSGVIYPPAYLDSLKNAGDAFRDCCPKADDIWLHVIAIRAGFKIRQINKKSRHFPIVPKSSGTALMATNLYQGHNDIQIKKSYTVQDIGMIRASSEALT
jgi:hypothetical protein